MTEGVGTGAHRIAMIAILCYAFAMILLYFDAYLLCIAMHCYALLCIVMLLLCFCYAGYENVNGGLAFVSESILAFVVVAAPSCGAFTLTLSERIGMR